MDEEIWVLGGTGRSGSAIAGALTARGLRPVLVGRDAARLEAVAATLPGARTLVAGSVAAMVDQVQRQRPAVVVNTVGPFSTTALPVARACLVSSHYLDLANDVVSALAVLGLHAQAAAADRTFVTGAGFGVTATESVVRSLCQGRPAAAQVRVNGAPSVELDAGVVGQSLAATILDGLPAGGRRYTAGRLVRAPLGGAAEQLTLPDGTTVTTASAPLGELVAAQRASGAPSVVAASTEVPSSPLIRLVARPAGLLLRAGPVRSFATGRLAAVKIEQRDLPREHSWAHARVHWDDGTMREGWLRLGSASAFTASVAALTASWLLDGRAPAGAHTPAAAFGPELAVQAGGRFVLDQD